MKAFCLLCIACLLLCNQELSMECVSLREERDKLLEELRRLSSPSPTSSTSMDQEEDNSLGNISLLQ